MNELTMIDVINDDGVRGVDVGGGGDSALRRVFSWQRAAANPNPHTSDSP